MNNKTCDGTSQSCRCYEGHGHWTPLSTVNRPQLNSLRYRIGTHATFLETMKARLGSMRVDVPGAQDGDGQPLETLQLQPLRGLTSRDTSDPAVALLDGWATVADVLTFYQERIANEGYLRTATERRSVLELARLVGYDLRPGVASSVYLAYTVDEGQSYPVEIPAGARAQSTPGPGEMPQAFETSEGLTARAAWNNLQIRLNKPPKITFTPEKNSPDSVLSIDKVYVAGINANLKPGDLLLFVFHETGENSIVRTVVKAEVQFEDNRTEVRLQPLPALTLTTLPALVALIKILDGLVNTNSNSNTESMKLLLESLRDDVYLAGGGVYAKFLEDPVTTAASLDSLVPPKSSSLSSSPPEEETTNVLGPDVQQDIDNFIEEVMSIKSGQPRRKADIAVTEEVISKLLSHAAPQVSDSLHLVRSLSRSFAPAADTHIQLLVNFAPSLKDTFYTAMANANISETPSELRGVYALRLSATLFGSTVPRQVSYYADGEIGKDCKEHKAGEPKPPGEWREWPLEKDENNNTVFLDQAYETILPESYVIVQTQGLPQRFVRPVSSVQTVSRTAYGLSGKTTKINFREKWWAAESADTGDKKRAYMAALRGAIVYGGSEKLELADEPIAATVPPADVSNEDATKREIELEGVYNELTSGRWVIFSGERADIPGVSGIKSSELLMIAGLRHGFDPALADDKIHTTLILATPPAYRYKRETLTIYGNVVKATHGETRIETLGSGEGSKAGQSFVLKQPPLTFVPAPTPSGVESTLKVYVNDVEWKETDTLTDLKPKDRYFITRSDDDDKTTLVFGNGKAGARLPTGAENVKAVYRNGIGTSGNVLADQINLMLTRPLGVKSVANPMDASGGADKETRDQARENVPLALMALDRLVSVQDYAYFTRTYAGIGKADARRLSDSQRELVHITIAGTGDIPIDPVSSLYRNLLTALRKYGDPAFQVQIDTRELLVLVLSAKIGLSPGYLWEPVAKAIRYTLFDTLGFQKRSLGQSVLLSEVISIIQHIKGVEYVDVDAFGGIPEKKVDECTEKPRLLTPDELAARVKFIVNPALASFILKPEDLVDPRGLMDLLLNPNSDRSLEAVFTYLFDQFSSDLKKQLKESVTQNPEKCLIIRLIDELNKILMDSSPLYTKQRFLSLELPNNLVSVSKSTSPDQSFLHFNRLFLEYIFQGKFRPSAMGLNGSFSQGLIQRVSANLARVEKGIVRPAQLAIFLPSVPDTLILNQMS